MTGVPGLLESVAFLPGGPPPDEAAPMTSELDFAVIEDRPLYAAIVEDHG